MPLHTQVDESSQDDAIEVNPVYVQELSAEIPRYRLAEHGMLPRTALQLVRDELILDGNARLNLATFVTTWMEPEAEQLMAECAAKNMIDKDEYPQTAELERRCVNILSSLWHAPAGSQAAGCSTTGSSEACMLGGMALLWRWRARRKAAGASGGFVATFLQPDLEWDFRVPRVASINASGHKYGLVYPGVGWILWRAPDALPDDLVFRVNYLGGEMPTFALNFSRPGAQVAAQYYNFIRLGRQGYRRVHQTCQDVALHLSGEIAKMGPFELLTEGRDLPVFAFKLRDDVTGYSVFDVSERLRMRGWQVPAYTFPADLTDTAVMRIVVRNGFSMDLANLLLADLRKHVKVLEHHPQTQPPPEIQHMRESFKH